MPTTTRQRLHQFDMLKGVAIFLVVMGHVITMCVREIDRATLFKLIEHIHMPIFFVVSGWFCIRQTEDGSLRPITLGKRAAQLLIPLIVVSSLWSLYFSHSGLQSPIDASLNGIWSSTWKSGYWFTLVLFEIVVVMAALAATVLKKASSAATWIASGIATYALLWVLYLYVVPTEIGNYMSLELVIAFWPAFFFGAAGRRFKDGFMRTIRTSTCQTVALTVLAVTMYMGCWPWEFGLEGPALTILNSIVHLTLAAVALNVFERWSNHAFAEDAAPTTRRIASTWCYLGEQSLAIYLLHYFFLFPLGDVLRPMLESVNVAIVPLGVVAAVVAVPVIAAVLMVVKIIEPSKLFTFLLTGKR